MPDPFLKVHPGRHTGALMAIRRERAGISIEAVAAEIAGASPDVIRLLEGRKIWSIQATTIYGEALKRIQARRQEGS